MDISDIISGYFLFFPFRGWGKGGGVRGGGWGLVSIKNRGRGGVSEEEAREGKGAVGISAGRRAGA